MVLRGTSGRTDPATILITGASGTVGSSVAQALAQGYPEHRLLLGTSQVRAEAGWVRFDFLDPSTFPAVLPQVDRIFFMRPPALADVEQEFGPFLDALASCPRLESVVFLSIQGAEAMPWVPHRKIELALESRNLPGTVLRPSFFFQNLTGTHGHEIRDTGALTLPAGRGRTAFVDTRDIAEVAAAILARPDAHRGKAYELTGTQSLTYFEVMEALAAATGRPLSYRPVGFWRFYRHCRQRGISRDQGLVMSMLYGLCRFGQASRLTDELRQLLGRTPRGLAEFSADFAARWSL